MAERVAARDQLHLRRPAGEAEPCWAALSPDERARALSFAHDAHRAAYVRAHGAMRTILVAYVESTPGGLMFEHGPFGKPSLASDANDGRLEFNLSHSG